MFSVIDFVKVGSVNELYWIVFWLVDFIFFDCCVVFCIGVKYILFCEKIEYGGFVVRDGFKGDDF